MIVHQIYRGWILNPIRGVLAESYKEEPRYSVSSNIEFTSSPDIPTNSVVDQYLATSQYEYEQAM
jgi:hypothetical protein